MEDQSTHDNTRNDPPVRALSFITEVRRSELRGFALFFLTGFLTLAAYYIIRALREGFILVDFGADARAMAVGVATLVLMIVVPLYARLRRRMGSNHLVIGVYAFFAFTLLGFYFAWEAGWKIGFVFFVWVGLFGLMVVAQFWALATGCWSEGAGKRLFPAIMIGANLGALAGTEVANIASHNHGMHALMIIGFVLMLVVMALLPVAWRTAPGGSVPVSAPAKKGRLLGGFALIAADRYLLLIAMTVVMLNLVNSVGEYLFAHFVEMHAQARVPADAGPQAQAEYVTRVYASFMLGYTTLGLLLQTFLVARLFRWIGIGRSAIILPALMAASYLLIAFIPVFSLIRFVKIAENATDYSLMGTIRQALFLPTSEEAKFDGKTAIDTFFWRVGDLLQAGIVYAGVHWFDWSVRGFALMTAGMCLVFLACSVALSREYRRRVPDDGLVVDGRVVVRPGRHTDTPISEVHDDWPAAGLENIATFVDDGTPLPAWLEFDFSQGKLKARTPDEFSGLMRLRVEGQEPGAGIQRQFPFTLVAVRDH